MLTMNEFKEAVTKDFKRFLDESFKDKESERRDVEGLREIVCSVNEESLPVDEILSDSVYYYSRKSGLQLL